MRARRSILRVCVLAAAAALPVAAAVPAYATVHPDGSDSGPGMSVGLAMLVFLGIPVAVTLLIGGLVTLLTVPRKRYRPGTAWTAGPVWFNGAGEDAEGAVANAKPSPVGGATSAQW